MWQACSGPRGSAGSCILRCACVPWCLCWGHCHQLGVHFCAVQKCSEMGKCNLQTGYPHLYPGVHLGGGVVPVWRLIGFPVFRLGASSGARLWFLQEQHQAESPCEVCPVAALTCTKVAMSPLRSCSVAPCGCPNATGTA